MNHLFFPRSLDIPNPRDGWDAFPSRIYIWFARYAFIPGSHLDFEVPVILTKGFACPGLQVSAKAIHGEQDDHFFFVVVANALVQPRTSFLGLSTSPDVFGHIGSLVHLESGMQ